MRIPGSDKEPGSVLGEIGDAGEVQSGSVSEAGVCVDPNARPLFSKAGLRRGRSMALRTANKKGG